MPLEFIGIASALLVLAAFVLNEYGMVSSDDVRYDAVNFIASAGLLYFALESQVWPFVITNGVWVLVSGIDVVRYVFGGGERRGRRPRI